MLTMTKRHLAMIALTLAFGLAAGAADAQATRTDINAAVSSPYPPWAYRDLATNRLIGFNIDLTEAIAAKMGANVNWTESAFAQLMPALLTKRADVIVGIADRPERRESMNFLDYAWDRSVFFTLTANAAQFPTADSLCGKRVSTTRSTSWPAAIAKWSAEHCAKAGKPEAIVLGADTSVLLELEQGRADAGVQGGANLAYQNTQKNNRFVAVGNLFTSEQADQEAFLLSVNETMGMAFSKDDPKLGEALKKALATLMADGTYRELIRKWNVPQNSAMDRPLINGKP